MKVGDRCRWREVPPGSLVRDAEGDYAVRLPNGRGLWVYVSRSGPTTLPWRGCGERGEWPWPDDGDRRHGALTVIKVGLRGGEGAGMLRYDALVGFAAAMAAKQSAATKELVRTLPWMQSVDPKPAS